MVIENIDKNYIKRIRNELEKLGVYIWNYEQYCNTSKKEYMSLVKEIQWLVYTFDTYLGVYDNGEK